MGQNVGSRESLGLNQTSRWFSVFRHTKNLWCGTLFEDEDVTYRIVQTRATAADNTVSYVPHFDFPDNISDERHWEFSSHTEVWECHVVSRVQEKIYSRRLGCKTQQRHCKYTTMLFIPRSPVSTSIVLSRTTPAPTTTTPFVTSIGNMGLTSWDTRRPRSRRMKLGNSFGNKPSTTCVSKTASPRWQSRPAISTVYPRDHPTVQT